MKKVIVSAPYQTHGNDGLVAIVQSPNVQSSFATLCHVNVHRTADLFPIDVYRHY